MSNYHDFAYPIIYGRIWEVNFKKCCYTKSWAKGLKMRKHYKLKNMFTPKRKENLWNPTSVVNCQNGGLMRWHGVTYAISSYLVDLSARFVKDMHVGKKVTWVEKTKFAFIAGIDKNPGSNEFSNLCLNRFCW